MDESFLPYAMLEPLMQEGMTFEALGDLILTRIGLSSDKYCLETRPHSDAEPLAVVIRDGLHVTTKEAALGADARCAADEPVR